MSEVVNLTPHAVSLADADGNVIATFPPSGQVARVATTTEVVGELMGRPISRTTFGKPTGIPDPQEGVVFLVSTVVAKEARRPDVVSPDTGPTAIRGADGLGGGGGGFPGSASTPRTRAGERAPRRAPRATKQGSEIPRLGWVRPPGQPSRTCGTRAPKRLGPPPRRSHTQPPRPLPGGFFLGS
jgi:hypothetical protein